MQRIYEWLENHKQEFLDDLARIIEIPSVSDSASDVKPFGAQCRRALDTMLEIGAKYGFDGEDYDGYAASLSLNSNPDCIGIWGHVDVVPADDQWEFEPFKLTVKDGFAIGRGVADDKGPCIEALYAMRAAKELGLVKNKNIRLYFGASEETGMDDIDYFNAHYNAPPLSLIADSDFPVCFGESGIFGAVLTSKQPLESVRISGGTADNVIPSSARAVMAYSADMEGLDKELYTVERSGDSAVITAHGVSAHAAHPENAKNAICILLSGIYNFLPENDRKIIKPFVDMSADSYAKIIGADYSDDTWGELTYASTMISTNDSGRLSLTVNCRYPKPVPYDAVKAATEKFCSKHNLSLALTENIPATALDENHPALSVLTDVYNEVTGEESRPYTARGVTYAKKVPNAVTFGPEFPNKKRPPFITRAGHGELHQPDECVAVDEMLRAAAIYARAFEMLDKMK